MVCLIRTSRNLQRRQRSVVRGEVQVDGDTLLPVPVAFKEVECYTRRTDKTSRSAGAWGRIKAPRIVNSQRLRLSTACWPAIRSHEKRPRGDGARMWIAHTPIPDSCGEFLRGQTRNIRASQVDPFVPSVATSRTPSAMTHGAEEVWIRDPVDSWIAGKVEAQVGNST